jgi:hypothetical protein
MNNIIEPNGEVRFANGQNNRDLRVNSDVTEPEIQLPVEDLERTDSSHPLEALRKDSEEVLERRIQSIDGTKGSPLLRVEAHGTAA